MTKQFEELRQAYKELLADNQQLTADNRKLRKEVTELKQLNDGYVKIIAKNKETNNKLMATVQKQTGGDLISRADAIEMAVDVETPQGTYERAIYVDDLMALPSAETHEIRTETHGVCLISKDDAMGAVQDHFNADGFKGYDDGQKMMDRINALPSAEHGWRIGEPTEQGEYMVTVDSFGYKHIDLFYYGKPMMPNRKVRGKCWYRSDDEWCDVVYDAKDIIAWQPLPTPYKGGDSE